MFFLISVIFNDLLTIFNIMSLLEFNSLIHNIMNQENKSRSIKYFFALIVVIVLIFVGFTTYNKPKTTNTFKIGVILPLSGDLAIIGTPAKSGAEMALASFTNTKNKYELIFEDDQYNVNKTVTIANKLISIDKVNAIVTLGSAEGNGVKPLANNAKVIHFNTAASDQTIPDGHYIFTHWTPPAEEAKAMINELINRKINKVAIFTTNNDGMIAITNELEKQLLETNIQVTMSEKINVSGRDFRTQIAKLKGELPDIIVMQNTPPELEILARQIKEAGVKAPMTSIEVFDTSTAADLFRGYWYASVSNFTDLFRDDYKNKYGLVPELATGNIYDIISLIITAAENTKGAPTADNVSAELLKIKNFNGAMGELSMGPSGMVLSKATIKTVK